LPRVIDKARKHWGSGVPLPRVVSFLRPTNQEVASSTLAARTILLPAFVPTGHARGAPKFAGYLANEGGQGAPIVSISYRTGLLGPVNNREQFAADFLDGVPN